VWLEFFAQNIHFAINLFTALVCAAICWLYFDAWMTRHAAKELIKWIGFGLLAVCYLLQATVIEEVILAQLPLGRLTAGAIITLRLLAYAAIIVGPADGSSEQRPGSRRGRVERSRRQTGTQTASATGREQANQASCPDLIRF
jgi:hypothetical protein